MGHPDTGEYGDPLSRRIAKFLGEIGIVVRWERIVEPTVLTGLTIDRGQIVVDETELQHPGDLLHEAGHLAILPATERTSISGTAGSDPGHEMTAIAWSYAALCHLNLEPEVVFHEDGYRGGSANLIDNFSQGRYIGVPVLQWLGMTADDNQAARLGVDPFPKMLQWVLD
jgi:hypothetical protein